MDNDDFSLKIAIESAKTQQKMRDQFIEDFMEQTNVKDLSDGAVEILRYVLKVAYNKGAIDTLAINATANLGIKEGGEDYEI